MTRVDVPRVGRLAFAGLLGGCLLLAAGCQTSLVESKARELFSQRLATVNLSSGEEPSLQVDLSVGPLADRDGVAMMGAMATQLSAPSTMIVGIFAPRSDGTGDQWVYEWSPATKVLLKLVGRSSDPKGRSEITEEPAAVATGVSLGTMVSNPGSVVLTATPAESSATITP